MRKEERRYHPLPNAAILRTEGEGMPDIAGHAAVFFRDGDVGTEYELWPGVTERIADDAFADVMDDDVRALFNHDSNFVLGRTSNGTLEVGVDSVGATYRATPVDNALTRSVVSYIERGDVSQSSFGFYVGKATWIEEEDRDIRVIDRLAEWLDVSPVTYPAYTATDVSVLRNAYRQAHDEWREWNEKRTRRCAGQRRQQYERRLRLAQLSLGM